MMTAQTLASVKQVLLEKLHQEIVPQLEQLVQQLPEQLGQMAQAETQLHQGMLKIAGLLLQLWGQTADRTVERPCCPQCQMPMRHRGYPSVRLVTTLGTIRYCRVRWRCEDCGQECYPHDAPMRFLTHGVSWPLARICGRLACQLGSFEEARDNLQEDYHVHLATETVREVAQAAGSLLLQQEEDYRRQVAQRELPLPESDKSPEKACLYADGTMVHSEGDWHEVRVITVATEDACGNPCQRQSRAAFWDVEEVAWSLVLLARQLGYQNARQRAFIADGAAWLWKLQESYFPTAVPILDWYHLAEKVHAAANALHGQGNDAAKQWARRLKDYLWDGRLQEALAIVGQEHARARARLKRQKLHELWTYLENNADHVDYPRYRALGLSIGSGQVEAQCKTLVGARCKRAGMRDWTNDGAEAILRLRAAMQDKTYNELWERRLRPAA
jgi:hypothetical protein